jgi:hypothetical protein
MTCVSPPELDTIQLQAYVDQEASPAVIQHVDRCAHCRTRAEDLAKLQLTLTERLFRATCPLPEELGEYQLGLTTPSRKVAIAQHLLDCPHCRAEMDQLASFLDQPDPQLKPGIVEQAIGPIKVLIANLLSGPSSLLAPGKQPLSPALAGVRGDQEEPFVYRAGDIQIMLQIQPDAQQVERRALLGLIMGMANPQAMRAILYQQSQRKTSVDVDDLGNFVIGDLSPVQYELILTSTDTEIHIQDVDLSSA